MRGEYQVYKRKRVARKGSPPLARGILRPNSINIGFARITPACAGNTDLRERISTVYKDHPRLRGEYVSTRPCQTVDRGSPPLARGIRPELRAGSHQSGITPACAGNTPLMSSVRTAPRDHPRLRGEYFCRLPHFTIIIGSPPLARGIRRQIF